MPMDIDTADILAKANNIAEEIKNCAIYQNYRTAVERLKTDSESVEKIAFFKKENIKYRTKIMQNLETGFDDEKYISSLYTELMLIQVCREFLENEKKILNLLSGTLDAISSGCELEFDIFERNYQ